MTPAGEAQRLEKALRAARAQIARRLELAGELRDRNMHERVLRVSHSVRLLAEALGASKETCEFLFQAAPLYDIGRLGVPDAVLDKPGPLTRNETEQVRAHAALGARLIGHHDDRVLQCARVMALSHHERWDGQGYPRALSGEDIPWPGRLVAVADAYEAMTSDRPHRPAMAPAAAAGVVALEAGTHFDPRVCAAFRKALPAIVKVQLALRAARVDPFDLDFTAPEPGGAVPDAPPALRVPAAAETTVRQPPRPRG